MGAILRFLRWEGLTGRAEVSVVRDQSAAQAMAIQVGAVWGQRWAGEKRGICLGTLKGERALPPSDGWERFLFKQ